MIPHDYQLRQNGDETDFTGALISQGLDLTTGLQKAPQTILLNAQLKEAILQGDLVGGQPRDLNLNGVDLRFATLTAAVLDDNAGLGFRTTLVTTKSYRLPVSTLVRVAVALGCGL